jgi:hypothetical protein
MQIAFHWDQETNAFLKNRLESSKIRRLTPESRNVTP